MAARSDGPPPSSKQVRYCSWMVQDACKIPARVRSGPDDTHGAILKVRLAPIRPPSAMLDAMEKVLLSSNAILKTPAPSATIRSLDKDAVEFELGFWVSDVSKVGNARNELFDLVFRHVEASGLQMSGAEGAILVSIDGAVTNEHGPKRPTTPLRLMDSISLFAGLTDSEKEDIASNMVRLSFRKGEIIAHRETALTSLMIVRSGVVALEETDDGTYIDLARLAPGDFFGERGVLLGALEIADVRALTPVVIYEIPKERLAAVLRERPAIAEELGLLLSARTKAEEASHRNGDADAGAHPPVFSPNRVACDRVRPAGDPVMKGT